MNSTLKTVSKQLTAFNFFLVWLQNCGYKLWSGGGGGGDFAQGGKSQGAPLPDKSLVCFLEHF